MTQGDRIKALRKKLGLTLEKFGDRIGLKKSAMSSIENGRNALTEQTLLSICNKSWDGRYVNPDWLRDGSGDMFLELSRRDELLLWASQSLSNESEDFINRFVNVLSELDVNDWELLANTAETLARQKKKD